MDTLRWLGSKSYAGLLQEYWRQNKHAVIIADSGEIFDFEAVTCGPKEWKIVARHKDKREEIAFFTVKVSEEHDKTAVFAGDLPNIPVSLIRSRFALFFGIEETMVTLMSHLLKANGFDTLLILTWGFSDIDGEIFWKRQMGFRQGRNPTAYVLDLRDGLLPFKIGKRAHSPPAGAKADASQNNRSIKKVNAKVNRCGGMKKVKEKEIIWWQLANRAPEIWKGLRIAAKNTGLRVEEIMALLRKEGIYFARPPDGWGKRFGAAIPYEKRNGKDVPLAIIIPEGTSPKVVAHETQSALLGITHKQSKELSRVKGDFNRIRAKNTELEELKNKIEGWIADLKAGLSLRVLVVVEDKGSPTTLQDFLTKIDPALVVETSSNDAKAENKIQERLDSGEPFDAVFFFCDKDCPPRQDGPALWRKFQDRFKETQTAFILILFYGCFFGPDLSNVIASYAGLGIDYVVERRDFTNSAGSLLEKVRQKTNNVCCRQEVKADLSLSVKSEQEASGVAVETIPVYASGSIGAKVGESKIPSFSFRISQSDFSNLKARINNIQGAMNVCTSRHLELKAVNAKLGEKSFRYTKDYNNKRVWSTVWNLEGPTHVLRDVPIDLIEINLEQPVDMIALFRSIYSDFLRGQVSDEWKELFQAYNCLTFALHKAFGVKMRDALRWLGGVNNRNGELVNGWWYWDAERVIPNLENCSSEGITVGQNNGEIIVTKEESSNYVRIYRQKDNILHAEAVMAGPLKGRLFPVDSTRLKGMKISGFSGPSPSEEIAPAALGMKDSAAFACRYHLRRINDRKALVPAISYIDRVFPQQVIDAYIRLEAIAREDYDQARFMPDESRLNIDEETGNLKLFQEKDNAIARGQFLNFQTMLSLLDAAIAAAKQRQVKSFLTKKLQEAFGVSLDAWWNILEDSLDAKQLWDTYGLERDPFNVVLSFSLLVVGLRCFYGGLITRRVTEKHLKELRRQYRDDAIYAKIDILSMVIPLEIIRFAFLMQAMNITADDAEHQAVLKAMQGINPNVRVQPRGKRKWVRDLCAWLGVDFEHCIIAKDSGPQQIIYANGSLEEGGVLLAGKAATPFVLLASGLENDIVNKDFPKLASFLKLKYYVLPRGFMTLKTSDGEYEVISSLGHLDTVMGIAPSSCTQDGRTKLIIDPNYHHMVRNVPEFKRFMQEQQQAMDVVEIDRSETHLHLANFSILLNPDGEPRLLFNRDLEHHPTLSRLNLKPEVLVQPEIPIIRTPYLYHGGLRCLTNMLPAQFILQGVSTAITVVRGTMEREPAMLAAAETTFTQNSSLQELCSRLWITQVVVRFSPRAAESSFVFTEGTPRSLEITLGRDMLVDSAKVERFIVGTIEQARDITVAHTGLKITPPAIDSTQVFSVRLGDPSQNNRSIKEVNDKVEECGGMLKVEENRIAWGRRSRK